MSTLPGIKANKYIRTILVSDDELTDLVKPENIKIMVLAPTTFPFISIKRSALETNYVKEMAIEDQCTIEIAVISDEYSVGMEIAEKVREILDYKVYKNTAENVFISEIRFFDCIEDTIDDVFVQNLQFQIKIQNICE